MPNFCLIITATIKPVNGVYSLTVVDRDIRKRQYIDSLKYAIDYYNIERIIFCVLGITVDNCLLSIANVYKCLKQYFQTMASIGG